MGLSKNAGNEHNRVLPKGSVQGLTDFGVPGYGGPFPPEGDKPHGYIITVFALDVASLNLNNKSVPALVGFMLNKHVISKASLIIYSKR